MTHLAEWLSPVSLRLLALALLHFLWQGAALAALAFLLMETCRGVAARYAVGVGALVLMLAAPLGTFLFLERQEQGNLPAVLTVHRGPAASAARLPVVRTRRFALFPLAGGSLVCRSCAPEPACRGRFLSCGASSPSGSYSRRQETSRNLLVTAAAYGLGARRAVLRKRPLAGPSGGRLDPPGGASAGGRNLGPE